MKAFYIIVFCGFWQFFCNQAVNAQESKKIGKFASIEDLEILRDSTNRDYLFKEFQKKRDILARISSKYLAQFNAYFKKIKSVSTENENSIGTSPSQSTSGGIWDFENRIGIKDLIQNAGEIFSGKFLLCRSITPIIFNLMTLRLELLVDDPAGKLAGRLSLLIDDSDLLNLPIGTIMAIRNPQLSIASTPSISISTESQNNIVILTENHKIVSGISWKGKLSDFEENFCEDLVSESESDTDEKLLVDTIEGKINYYGNKSENFLRNNRFHRTLENAKKILEVEPGNKKGLLFISLALMGLGQYSSVIKILKKNHLLLRDSKEFEEILSASQKFQEKSENGAYDFVEFKKAILLNPSKQFFSEIPNYVSTQLGISPDVGGGKGRGIISISDKTIKAGTLLVATSAFSYLIFEGENQFIGGERLQMLDEIIKMLEIEPEKRNEFYSLPAGNELGHLEGTEKIPKIDLERTINILKWDFSRENTSAAITLKHSIGIWVIPALFNNDCIDWNSEHEIIGDFIFIRAIQDIKPGQELTIHYHNPWDLNRISDFKCNCRLCQAEQSSEFESSITQRTDLNSQLYQAEAENDFGKMGEIIQGRILELSKVSKYSNELLVQLIPWLFKLERWQEKVLENQRASIETFKKILKILDLADCPSEARYSALLTLTVALAQRENKREFEKYLELLMKESKLRFGSSEIIKVDDERGWKIIQMAIKKFKTKPQYPSI